MIDVLYFAWVRERIGLPRERLQTNATTVAELVAELSAREDRYAMAFADLSSLRVLWHLAAPCPAWLKEAFIDWLVGPQGQAAIAAFMVDGDMLFTPSAVGAKPTH